ncbi:TPA: hypothetical protein ACH3X1_012394 [Trebouxia sp. C0004]
MLSSDFEPEFQERIDSYLKEGLVIPIEVDQLVFSNHSRYGTGDFSTLFSNVLSSLLIVLRQGENFLC